MRAQVNVQVNNVFFPPPNYTQTITKSMFILFAIVVVALAAIATAIRNLVTCVKEWWNVPLGVAAVFVAAVLIAFVFPYMFAKELAIQAVKQVNDVAKNVQKNILSTARNTSKEVGNTVKVAGRKARTDLMMAAKDTAGEITEIAADAVVPIVDAVPIIGAGINPNSFPFKHL